VLLGGFCIGGLIFFLFQPAPVTRHLGCYGLFFLIGVMSARRNWTPPASGTSALLLIAATLIALCVLVPGLRHLIENAKHGATATELHSKRIFQVALAIISAPVALFTVRNRSGATDRRISELTYEAYLMQWPIMMLHSHYFAVLAPLDRIPSVLAAWAVVGVVSWVVFWYLDQPLERARKRWVSSKMVAVSA
jgi:peptidoglycan/LPS O-acetylase OafA/YrhL